MEDHHISRIQLIQDGALLGTVMFYQSKSERYSLARKYRAIL